MMKKFCLWLLVVLVLSIFVSSAVCTETMVCDNFEYYISDDGKAHITGYCGNASQLTIPSLLAGVEVYEVCDSFDCSEETITELTISDGIVQFFGNWNNHFDNLISLNIPKSMLWISGLYYYTSLEAINVDKSNPYYESRDGVLYNRYSQALTAYPVGRKDETFSVPDDVMIIKYNAFKGCKNIKTVVLPEGILVIENNAFSECTNLSSITLPKSLFKLDEGAFTGCDKLSADQLRLTRD